MKKQLILLLSSLALISCGQEEPISTKVDDVLISSSEQISAKFSFKTKSISLVEDSTAQIEFESSGKPRFSSSAVEVAELNSNGKLIAKNPGKAIITGTVGTSKDTLEVIVTSSSNSSFSIKLEQSSEVFSLENVNTFQIKATLFENDTLIENPSFTYTSSSEDIATVSSAGLITPKKEGEAYIDVSYGDLKASFTADVYTKFIDSTSAWLNMIATDSQYNERYCLVSDLDFSGVSYTGYPRLGFIEDTNKAFCGEINGRGYSVSNVTMAIQADFHQSLFGKIRAATIKNIAFENIEFTESREGRLAGLAGYALNDSERGGDQMKVNRIENVLLDLTFPATKGRCSGLFSQGYQYSVSNVFLSMQKKDGSSFDVLNDSLINEYNYFWYGNGSIGNSCLYSEGTLLSASVGSTENYGTVSLNQVCMTSSIMDAYKGAYDYLDKNVWDLYPNSNPKLKNNI